MSSSRCLVGAVEFEFSGKNLGEGEAGSSSNLSGEVLPRTERISKRGGVPGSEQAAPPKQTLPPSRSDCAQRSRWPCKKIKAGSS